MKGIRWWSIGLATVLILGFAGCGDEDEPTRDILQTAQLQVFVTASPHSGVAPLQVRFLATVVGNNGGVSYAWNFGDGANSTDASPQHTYSAAGTYNASLVVTDAAGNEAANGLTISVEAVPNVVVTADPTEGTVPLTVDFTCSNDAWAGPLNYLWEFGDGRTSTQQNPTHTYVAGGNYAATCTTLSGDAEASATAVIQAIADSVPAVTAAADPSEGIAPLDVQFSSVVRGGDGDLSYAWDFGDHSAIAETTDPSHTFTDAGVYLVLLTVTDEDGDEGSDVLHVVVGGDEGPAAAVSADPESGIAPLWVQFSVSAAGGNPPLEYDWDFGDESEHSEVPEPSHLYATAGSYTVSLTVTDQDGDTTSAEIGIEVAEDSIPASITVSADPQTGTAPLRVSFDCVVDGGNPPFSYSWEFGDGEGSLTKQPIHTYTDAGFYTSTCTAIDANEDVIEGALDIDVIAPDLPPVAVAEIVEGECALPGWTTVILDATGSSDPEGQPLSYLWAFDRIPVGSMVSFSNPTVTNPSFVPDLNGTYEIRLFVSDGTHRTGSDVLTVVVSDVPGSVELVDFVGLTGVANEPFGESLIVQVFNDCGDDLDGVPLPYVPVRWYGDNAFPRSNFSETDEDGFASVVGRFGLWADMPSLVTANCGCVHGTFDLTVEPGQAHYLVMQHMDPTPVTPSDATEGVQIDLQLTDAYMNPVNGPPVEFTLTLHTGSDSIATLMAEEVVAPPELPPLRFDETELPELTDEVDDTGHFSTTVRYEANVETFDKVYVSIFVGTYTPPEGGDDIYIDGRGLWQAFMEDFEGDVEDWDIAEDSQWEIGTPAAGVGPGEAYSGDNCLGTVLDGDIQYSEGVDSDDVSFSTSFDDPYTNICIGILEFQHWYDMGRPCPRDCTNALGQFYFKEYYLLSDRFSDATRADDDSWDLGEPICDYPGPHMCMDENKPVNQREALVGSEERFAEAIEQEIAILVPTVEPFLGYGAETHGEWRLDRASVPRFEGGCEDVAPAVVVEAAEASEVPIIVGNPFSMLFGLVLNDEGPFGKGWYIDDLSLTLLLQEGFIPFVPGPPAYAHLEVAPASRYHGLSESCTFPADLVLMATDEYQNYLFEPGIPISIKVAPPSGVSANIEYEVVQGTFVSEVDGVITATTAEDGSVVIAVTTDTAGSHDIQTWIPPETGDPDITTVPLEFTAPPEGECCENAIELSFPVSSYTANIGGYLPNQQMLVCGEETTEDVVFKFHTGSTSATLSMETLSLPPPIIELQVQDGSTCPGTPVEPDGDECLEVPHLYSLTTNEDYLLIMRPQDPESTVLYITLSGS